MLLETFTGLLLFGMVALGLGWPLVDRFALSATEKILAATTLSVVAAFLMGWGIYVFSLPANLAWAIPALAATSLALRRSWLGILRDSDARSLLVGQLLITGWSVGWLALVVSYSGGDWIGDWLGHWHRVRFFLERWPRDTLFFGADPLASRPPLANVVTAVFVRLTRFDFAHYQLFMTVLNSVVYLPAALLARRFGGSGAAKALIPLLMLNPLFVENATYAWTKLSTAFFVLAALYFFLRATDNPAPRSAGPLVATALGGGMLCHYSAGPYLLVLAIAWFVLNRDRLTDSVWWKSTALAAAIGSMILASWFAWSIAVFGAHTTFFSNTSVTDQAPEISQQLLRVLVNVRNTLIPHFLRGDNFGFFAQPSTWGTWRDWFFQIYQRNLLFAVGAVAGLAVFASVARQWTTAPTSTRRFWVGFVGLTAILGIAAHGGYDHWGNTHICEQPLVLLALAFLAAQWPVLGPRWRCFLIAGAAIDFAAGILLQFGAQSLLLDHWQTPNRAIADHLANYSPTAQFNFQGKLAFKLQFFGDLITSHPALILALLTTLLLFAVVACHQSETETICKY